MDILNRLKTLERQAILLDTDGRERRDLFARVGEHSESFLEALPEQAVYTPPGDRDAALRDFAIDSGSKPLDDVLSALRQHVDGVGHNLGSSRFFAYIPSGSLYEAALADYLAAISNRYAGVGFAAPGVARMDETVLNWLAGLVGYPKGYEGDFTSGGSMAALSAVIAAREDRKIDSTNVARSVVYLTSQTHHTFSKALHVAGLSECIVRALPVDEGQRMIASGLQDCIQQDRDSGLNPWLVAATAGTTNVGAVDPLEDIAQVARDFDLWLHIDAAYGGAFTVCGEGRQRLAGLGQSDSLILDPHKGFFLNSGVGVVLVREGKKLYDAFAARGVYMQDVEDTERSACDLSPELTRPFRSLRLWLPLKVHGTAPFAAALEEKLWLAQYFYEAIASRPGFELQPPPDLSIVPFRYVPKRGDMNEFNRRIVEAIAKDGRVFMTSTTINGQYVIRMAILNYKTHLEDIDTALQVIDETVQHLLTQ